jgi:predicted molibdopterin-dependent oxidoreductase YjgC
MADVATLHLQPRPGTETACLQALVRLAEDAGRFDPAQIASLVQVDADALRQAAETCARADRAVIVCGQGSGPEADAPALATALRDLAAATGSGLLPMTSYGNLRGALDMGVRSTDGAAAMLGQVKALYVMGDDPLAVASSPATARQVLERLDFLVVQDVFLSETAKLAHVVLPGAIFAEKDGTMTSAEGRVQRLRPAVAPVGEARPDWWILSQLAARLGLPTAYDSPAAIRAEIAQTVPGYAEIAGDAWEDGWGLLLGPLSAPVATPSAGDEASPATANEEFPVLLWVDPHLYPWDGDAMAAHSPTLAREYLIRARDYRRGYVQMRPDEMRAQSVRPGAPVKIISAHGETTLPVMPENGIPAGTICLPYHLRELAAAVLGDGGFSPCPVRIERG